MNLIVRDYCKGRSESFVVYEGEVQNLPYWVAEKEFTAEECIEAEDNSLVIDISKPARSIKNNDIETNQKWLDTLSEEDTLLGLAGYLYHYDSGTVHDELFNDAEWMNVFNPMIDYVEKRIGGMAFDGKIHDWFRDVPFKR